jgi:isopenicillin-N N-acyltransferase like protein
MRPRVLISILLIALAVSPAFAGEPKVVAREGKGRLETLDGHRILHLAGTPREMGLQHGRLLRDVIRKNVLAIWNNETALGKEPLYLAYKAARGSMHRRLLPHVPKRFLEEIRGLAEGAGLSYEQVLCANLFPEAFHCSGMALMGKATRDRSLYHVRILDYMTEAGLQDAAVNIICEPEKGHAFLNVSFAGFVGSVTGMNRAGVCVGEMGGAGQLYWDGTPMSFLVRDVLERAGDLASARKIFRDAKRTCEYYYVISDGKARDAYGVQATPKRIHFVRPGEPFALIDLRPAPRGDSTHRRVTSGKFEEQKFFRRLRGPTGTITIHTPPADTVVISGLDRYALFCKRLEKRYGKVDEKALMEMVRRPVSMKSNLHVAIFHPETLRAWIAVAAPDGSPACNQPYVEIRLGTGRKAAEVEPPEGR